jgi:hypothetical protein
MAISVNVPGMYKDAPAGSASGSGDTEVQTGVNLFLKLHFHGVNCDVIPHVI